MDRGPKILYFQYTLHRLLLWYKEVNGTDVNNDISILKALKLLFFVSAVKASPHDHDSLVDTVFDSYVAMPYGHVEQDVYSEIQNNNGQLEFFTINNKQTVRNNDIELLIGRLDDALKIKVDESVDHLRNINKNLISLSAFDLVELSHLWFSWKKNYNIAVRGGLRKKDIPLEDIKTETKVYNLYSY